MSENGGVADEMVIPSSAPPSFMERMRTSAAGPTKCHKLPQIGSCRPANRKSKETIKRLAYQLQPRSPIQLPAGGD